MKEPNPIGRTGFLALRFFHIALLFLSSLVTAKVLGPTGRAQYLLPLTLASGIWALLHCSLDAATPRLLARSEAKRQELLGHLTTATLLISLVGVSATLLAATALRPMLGGCSSVTIVFAAFSVPCQLAIQFASSVLFLAGALRYYAAVSIVGGAAQLGVILGLSSTGFLTPQNAMGTILCGFVVTACGLIIGVARSAGYSSLRPRFQRQVARSLFRTGIALHPGNISLQLAGRADLFLVSAFTSTEKVGVYSLAITMSESLTVGLRSLGHMGLKEQTERTSRDALRFTLAFSRKIFGIGLTFAVVVIIIATPFVLFFYGPKWQGSIVPFIVLVLASIALVLEDPLRVFLAREGEPSIVSIITLGTVAINIGATILLVRKFGLVGAAIGSFIGYWSLPILFLIFIRRVADDEEFAAPEMNGPLVRGT